MGLRCSLLGHDYGEPEQEAEQDRRGGEKVLTVREFRRCSRCGAETVVSENTEVTTVEAASDTGDDATVVDAEDGTPVTADDAASVTADDAAPEADAGSETERAVESPSSVAGVDADPTVEDDAIILDDDADGAGTLPGPGVGDDEVALGSAAAPAAEDAAAGEADAVAGDDGAAESEAAAASADAGGEGEGGESEGGDAADDSQSRVTGDWPAADDVGAPAGEADEPRAWPEVDGEDEGFDAEPSSDDGPTVEFGGLTPEVADVDDAADDEWVGDDYVEAPAAGAGADGDAGGAAAGTVEGVGITSAGPVERSDEVVDAVLVCPECGFTQEAVATSLRQGDICPEPDCGRGYLTERER